MTVQEEIALALADAALALALALVATAVVLAVAPQAPELLLVIAASALALAENPLVALEPLPSPLRSLLLDLSPAAVSAAAAPRARALLSASPLHKESLALPLHAEAESVLHLLARPMLEGPENE